MASDPEPPALVAAHERALDFLDVATRLDALSRAHHFAVGLDFVGEQPSQGDLAEKNIQYDLREANIAVRMLRQRLVENRDFHRLWDQEMKRRFPDGQEGSFSITDGPLAEAATRREALRLEMLVLVKSLYQYLDAISELVDVPGVRHVSPQTREELKRVIRFRNQLITHKKNNEVFTRAATGAHAEGLEFTFGFGGVFSIPESGLQAIEALWGKAAPHLPPDVRNEVNGPRRRDLMYQHLNCLPGDLRGQVELLVKRWGVSSDPPLVLTQLFLALAEVFLAESRD